MSDHFDYIIIGGGVVGLCTAYNLTKVGIKPLIIEQFHLPHTRGSSHGQSRLLRTAHLEDSYTALCVESYKGWQNIEEEGEKQLIIATELLLIQDNYGESLRTTQKTMERLSLPHEWIDGKELRRRYPMLRYSESYGGVLDKTGSLILADKALHVLRRLVEKAGSEIRDGEKVLGIKPGQVVTIETSKAKYTCNKLFIATGPWSKEMTDSLGLNLPLSTMDGLHLFWRAPTTNPFVPGRVPIIHDVLADNKPSPYKQGFFLLLPTHEYPGLVKIVTRGEPPPFYCHPDERDKYSMQPMVDLVADYIKEHFPGVQTKPSIAEPCMYCLTPDKNGIVDRHPKFPNILFGIAFSGRGYMLAPIVGKVLTDLAMDRKPSVDMSPFAIGRFAQKSNL